MQALKDYLGKKVVLYFYPKDMTSGCTLEAQLFRDKEKEFKKLNTVIFGISIDSVPSHKKFCEKESLNFTLLSDVKKEVVEKYAVWREKSMYGKKYMGIVRESFLIDEAGKVVKHYQNVKPATHADDVLADLKTFTKGKNK